jgi:hypothetical protein
MRKHDLYVIECRTNGQLDFTGKQPESFFGNAAITGISEDAMAKVVYRGVGPDVMLDGLTISAWPSLIDPRWAARSKTW